MTCQACGKQNMVGNKFCEGCGADLQNLNFVPNQNRAYNPQANLGGGFSPYSQSEKIVKTSQYLLWSILLMIPIAGFICSIVFALDKNQKNRANYFKAALILRLIGFLLAIFAILFSALLFGGAFYVLENTGSHSIFESFDTIYINLLNLFI